MNSLFKFITTPVVFNNNIRKDIIRYLLISLLVLTITLAYFIYIGTSLKGVVLLATILLILLPFFVYFKLAFTRTAKRITKKETKEQQGVYYWAFSKKIFNLFIILITYLWLAILLLAAAMLVVSK